jgi:hypothetical protein
MELIAKGIEGFPFSVLHSFYKQNVGGIIENACISISTRVVTTRECFSMLEALSSLPPLSLIDLLHAVSGRFNF